MVNIIFIHDKTTIRFRASIIRNNTFSALAINQKKYLSTMLILDLLVYHQLNVYQTWHWYIFVLDLDPKGPILCSRKTDKHHKK
jgi:hypothetical protein